MKKGAGVHSARAVHVQVVCTLGTSHAPTGQMGGTTDLKLAGHMHTVPTSNPLGVPLLWGAGCTRQGRKTFLTRGPPVKVNFELATPNSVRGCTLALPTWCRMKKGDGVHCARAVHVQIFCTCSSLAAPTGQTVRAADAKLAGHMHASPAYMLFCGCRSCGVQAARDKTGKVYSRGILRF